LVEAGLKLETCKQKLGEGVPGNMVLDGGLGVIELRTPTVKKADFLASGIPFKLPA